MAHLPPHIKAQGGFWNFLTNFPVRYQLCQQGLQGYPKLHNGNVQKKEGEIKRLGRELEDASRTANVFEDELREVATKLADSSSDKEGMPIVQNLCDMIPSYKIFVI